MRRAAAWLHCSCGESDCRTVSGMTLEKIKGPSDGRGNWRLGWTGNDNCRGSSTGSKVSGFRMRIATQRTVEQAE